MNQHSGEDDECTGNLHHCSPEKTRLQGHKLQCCHIYNVLRVLECIIPALFGFCYELDLNPTSFQQLVWHKALLPSPTDLTQCFTKRYFIYTNQNVDVVGPKDWLMLAEYDMIYALGPAESCKLVRRGSRINGCIRGLQMFVLISLCDLYSGYQADSFCRNVPWERINS